MRRRARRIRGRPERPNVTGETNMPKYRVTFSETVKYEIEVEAENADDAEEFALEDFCNHGAPELPGDGATLESVEEIQPEPAGA